MKLNEEEMYNAHPWLLTVTRVSIVFIFPTLKHFPENACIFQKKSVILQKRNDANNIHIFWI